MGILLPKEALSYLNAREGDYLFVTEAPARALRMTAQSPGFDQQMAAADGIIRRYRNTLKKLAE